MIYLDNTAGALLSDAAKAAMNRAMDHPEDILGNATRIIKEHLGVSEGTVIFTSGATENASIASRATRSWSESRRVVVSVMDHVDTLNQVLSLDLLGVTELGSVPTKELTLALSDKAAEVVMLTLANAETGVITNFKEAADRVKLVSTALVYLDARHAPGRVRFFTLPPSVDMVGIDACIAHGPPGVGALWVRDTDMIMPVTQGGFEQGGLRPGSVNTIGVAGMAAALQDVRDHEKDVYTRLDGLRKHLDDSILAVSGVGLTFSEAPMVCCTSNYRVEGVDTRALELVLRKQGIAVGHRSSGLHHTTANTPLMKYLYPDDKVSSNIRMSVSWMNSSDDLQTVAQLFREAVGILRNDFSKAP